MVFSNALELLEMFDIDTEKNGAQDFCTLVELSALFEVHKAYRITYHKVVKSLLREQRISPMVFWSRMKRQCTPLLQVTADTWQALGVDFGYVPANMSDIALGVSRALAQAERARYLDFEEVPKAARDILSYTT